MARAVKSESCLQHWAVVMGLHVSQRQEETGTRGSLPEKEKCVYEQEKQKSQERKMTEWLVPRLL